MFHRNHKLKKLIIFCLICMNFFSTNYSMVVANTYCVVNKPSTNSRYTPTQTSSGSVTYSKTKSTSYSRPVRTSSSTSFKSNQTYTSSGSTIHRETKTSSLSRPISKYNKTTRDFSYAHKMPVKRISQVQGKTSSNQRYMANNLYYYGGFNRDYYDYNDYQREARRNVNEYASAQGDLYVINVNSNGYCNTNSNQMCKVNVYIEEDSRPITLLLSAYNFVEWHIYPSRNAKLKKIIVSGFHTPRVFSNSIPTTFLRRYYSFASQSGNSYNNARLITSKRPVSILTGNAGSDFLIV